MTGVALVAMVPFRGDGSGEAMAAPLLDFRLSNAQTSRIWAMLIVLK